MKRAIPHVIWVVGLVGFLFAAVYFGRDAIPYQDATPAMNAYQNIQMHNADICFAFAIALLAIGIGWSFGRWFWKRNLRTQIMIIFAPPTLWFMSALVFEWWFWRGVSSISAPGRGFGSGFLYLICLPVSIGLSILTGCICFLCNRVNCRSIRS